MHAEIIISGIHQLMQTKTSRKYLVSRLTPEMETKLVFLATKVIFVLKFIRFVNVRGNCAFVSLDSFFFCFLYCVKCIYV